MLTGEPDLWPIKKAARPDGSNATRRQVIAKYWLCECFATADGSRGGPIAPSSMAAQRKLGCDGGSAGITPGRCYESSSPMLINVITLLIASALIVGSSCGQTSEHIETRFHAKWVYDLHCRMALALWKHGQPDSLTTGASIWRTEVACETMLKTQISRTMSTLWRK
jgi:hypothetical protein